MKRWIASLATGLIAGCVVIACVAEAGAQGGRGGRNYDPKTVETVAGEVVQVERVPAPQGKGMGVHLALRTDAGATVDVHLGPAWYLDKQDLKIAAKDRIEVKGSRVTLDGKPALIAAEVKKGGAALVLRNEAGVPAWSGGGRRGGKGRAADDSAGDDSATED